MSLRRNSPAVRSASILLWRNIQQNRGCPIAEARGFGWEGTSLSVLLLLPGEIPANLIPAKIMERKEGDG